MSSIESTHTGLARSTRRAVAGLCLGVFVGGGALAQAPVATQPPPPGRTDGTSQWQRQQPTRERAQSLLRDEGIAPSPQERRRELRTLNRLHRELMPPGTTVPAPGVARRNPAPSGE